MMSKTWRLSVVDFAWTDQYAKNHDWAWTYNQAALYCNSHLCEIVDLKPKHLLPSLSGDRGITHRWISVKMLSGPKKGNIIIVAKAWLAFVGHTAALPALTTQRPTLPEPINWGALI